jgi:hypothetical protein
MPLKSRELLSKEVQQQPSNEGNNIGWMVLCLNDLFARNNVGTCLSISGRLVPSFSAFNCPSDQGADVGRVSLNCASEPKYGHTTLQRG